MSVRRTLRTHDPRARSISPARVATIIPVVSTIVANVVPVVAAIDTDLVPDGGSHTSGDSESRSECGERNDPDLGFHRGGRCGVGRSGICRTIHALHKVGSPSDLGLMRCGPRGAMYSVYAPSRYELPYGNDPVVPPAMGSITRTAPVGRSRRGRSATNRSRGRAVWCAWRGVRWGRG